MQSKTRHGTKFHVFACRKQELHAAQTPNNNNNNNAGMHPQWLLTSLKHETHISSENSYFMIIKHGRDICLFVGFRFFMVLVGPTWETIMQTQPIPHPTPTTPPIPTPGRKTNEGENGGMEERMKKKRKEKKLTLGLRLRSGFQSITVGR